MPILRRGGEATDLMCFSRLATSSRFMVMKGKEEEMFGFFRLNFIRFRKEKEKENENGVCTCTCVCNVCREKIFRMSIRMYVCVRACVRVHGGRSVKLVWKGETYSLGNMCMQ